MPVNSRVEWVGIAGMKSGSNPHETYIPRRIQVLALRGVEVRVLSWAPTITRGFDDSGH